MLRTTLAIAAATAVAALEDSYYGQPSPIISWSGKRSLFASSGQVVADDVTVDEAASFLSFDKDAAAPAVAVIFSFDKMPTNDVPHLIQDGNFGHVVEAVGDSASSVIIPNTYGAGETIARFVEDIPALFGVDASEQKPSLYLESEDSATAQLHDSFDVQELSRSGIARALNSDTDPVFVYASLSSSNDAAVKDILDTVKEAVGSDFVAFAVPVEYDQGKPIAARRLVSATAASSSGIIGSVTCTPGTMLGLLISVFLIFMLWMGYSSMMDIRSNDQFWCDENVPLGNKVEM